MSFRLGLATLMLSAALQPAHTLPVVGDGSESSYPSLVSIDLRPTSTAHFYPLNAALEKRHWDGDSSHSSDQDRQWRSAHKGDFSARHTGTWSWSRPSWATGTAHMGGAAPSGSSAMNGASTTAPAVDVSVTAAMSSSTIVAAELSTLTSLETLLSTISSVASSSAAMTAGAGPGASLPVSSGSAAQSTGGLVIEI